MSWSGTVTCSECYNQGHNRRSCPDLTERLQRQFDASKRNNDEWGIEYYGKQLAKRTGQDPHTGQKLKKQRGRCLEDMTRSYCSTSGHTRRTCTDLKEDVAVYTYIIKENRAAMIAAVEAAGIGIGSVIPHEYRGYHPITDEYGKHVDPKFVNGYRWDLVNESDGSNIKNWDFIQTVPLRTLGAGRRHGTAHLSLAHCEKQIDEGTGVTLSKKCDVRDRMPAGYLEGADLPQRAKTNFQGESRQGQYGYWKADYPHILRARYALGFDDPDAEEEE